MLILPYNIDLISTNLIYLGYDIFDNFFVQYGGAGPHLSSIFGSLISGSFVGMKAYYHIMDLLTDGLFQIVPTYGQVFGSGFLIFAPI